MLVCMQDLVKFCSLALKMLSGNENYDGITERLKDRMTERQNDRRTDTENPVYSPLFQSGAIIMRRMKRWTIHII